MDRKIAIGLPCEARIDVRLRCCVSITGVEVFWVILVYLFMIVHRHKCSVVVHTILQVINTVVTRATNVR